MSQNEQSQKNEIKGVICHGVMTLLCDNSVLPHYYALQYTSSVERREGEEFSYTHTLWSIFGTSSCSSIQLELLYVRSFLAEGGRRGKRLFCSSTVIYEIAHCTQTPCQGTYSESKLNSSSYFQNDSTLILRKIEKLRFQFPLKLGLSKWVFMKGQFLYWSLQKSNSCCCLYSSISPTHFAVVFDSPRCSNLPP